MQEESLASRLEAAADIERPDKVCIRERISKVILPNPVWRIPLTNAKELHPLPQQQIQLDANASSRDLRLFYALLKEKADKRKTRLQSYRVFTTTVRSFMESSQCRLTLARDQGQVVGCSLTVIYGGSAYNLYLETRGYLKGQDPSTGLLHDALVWAADKGARYLEFSRVAPGEGYIWREDTNLLPQAGARPIELPGETDLIFSPLLYRILRLAKPIKRWALI